MLLTHPCDTLGCAVVGLRTDLANTRSQQAIAVLGAQRDGVLFSILRAEWPAVRAGRQARLARYAVTASLSP